MNNVISQFKKDYLEKLKAQRQAIANRVETIYAQKCTQKKVEVDAESKKLDEVFEKFKQEKLIAVNAEIDKKAKEVQAKKESLAVNARETARAEAVSEVQVQIAEYDAEIAKTEKEFN